ncbi:MAG: hypothetical protein V9G21_02785 [Methylotenera sp.]|jgi:hypothetical protein|nr:hypothetical protein [Methylotenera sp.]HPH08134.1 hypothetical protein [Methylotenera sp.]HPM49526.1 hypothetical protein [Methylotenera sp.]HQM87969.1 hypothetical protein [Methylotenera sp.]
MKNLKLLCLFTLIFALNTNAHAGTYRVDDSATIVTDSQVKMRWRSAGANRVNGNIVDGSTFVNIRLNTSPWLNKTGQIYMVLPAQPIGQVVVDWKTQGKLLPGTLVSGNRTLVYAGAIQNNIIEDTFYIQVHSDGTRLNDMQRLEFYFEIDIN